MSNVKLETLTAGLETLTAGSHQLRSGNVDFDVTAFREGAMEAVTAKTVDYVRANINDRVFAMAKEFDKNGVPILRDPHIGRGDPHIGRGDPHISAGDPHISGKAKINDRVFAMASKFDQNGAPILQDPHIGRGDPHIGRGDPHIGRGDPHISAGDPHISGKAKINDRVFAMANKFDQNGAPILRDPHISKRSANTR
jgi:X-X-X-Leu-X-X-Gly heptad repeat protein